MKNAIKVMDFTAASVEQIVKNDLLNDKDPLVVMNALLLFSKSLIEEAIVEVAELFKYKLSIQLILLKYEKQ